NAKTSLCLPQRPLSHLRFLQNRDAPGEVTLLGLVADKLRKIQTLLADKDYILAIKAYQERLPILCSGDLIKDNNAFILKNPHNLTLDELW
ncbi:hypothetical protein QUB05_26235, partial [Microcoleus sp. F10-C6]